MNTSHTTARFLTLPGASPSWPARTSVGAEGLGLAPTGAVVGGRPVCRAD